MTGNTEKLAQTIYKSLPKEDCIYYGKPHPDALNADRIYIGFWTDKGTCDNDISLFLSTLTSQEVFLFGTAGFGGNSKYFHTILNRVQEKLPPKVHLIGSYMCQGKMPLSVRKRYEKMKKDSTTPNIDELLQNFDIALTHPDNKDLSELLETIQNI